MYYFIFLFFIVVFFCKQKTAYEMRISDWSSDVCSSDLKFFGNVIGRKVSHSVTILGVFISLLLSLHTMSLVLDGATFNGNLYTWMTVAGLKLEVGFLVDRDRKSVV